MLRQMIHEIYLITTGEEMNLQEIKLILLFVQNKPARVRHMSDCAYNGLHKKALRVVVPGKGCTCRDVLHQPSKMAFCCGLGYAAGRQLAALAGDCLPPAARPAPAAQHRRYSVFGGQLLNHWRLPPDVAG